jgi:hypothetical protein
VRPIPDWPAWLRQPDVRVVPVVCAGKVPPLAAGLIRSQYRGRSPEAPVYLDFEDRMKQSFGLVPGVPNVVVIDTLGRVRYRAHGLIGTTQFFQIAHFIEQLRREARTPPGP